MNLVILILFTDTLVRGNGGVEGQSMGVAAFKCLGTRRSCTADPSWAYRCTYGGTISSSHVSCEPRSKVYLIKDDPALIEQLRQRLERNRHT